MNGATASGGPAFALGVDVGGTKIAAGIVRFPEGRVVSRKMIATRLERGSAAVLDELPALAAEVRVALSPAEARQAWAGAGVGLCELVDIDGHIQSANCLPWTRKAVEERLAGHGPVIVEADVRAAAMAESLFGEGRGRPIFLYVTVGTGISSCLMLDGRPYLGARGLTGTFASAALGLRCDQCGAVHQRSLEQIASGPGIVQALRARDPESPLAGSARDVVRAATEGDPRAREVIEAATDALGAHLGLLVNILDPEAIVVGGGLGGDDGIYWNQLVASTRRHIWSEVHRDLPVVHATLGQDAGFLGAAAVAWLRWRETAPRTPGDQRKVGPSGRESTG